MMHVTGLSRLLILRPRSNPAPTTGTPFFSINSSVMSWVQIGSKTNTGNAGMSIASGILPTVGLRTRQGTRITMTGASGALPTPHIRNTGHAGVPMAYMYGPTLPLLTALILRAATVMPKTSGYRLIIVVPVVVLHGLVNVISTLVSATNRVLLLITVRTLCHQALNGRIMSCIARRHVVNLSSCTFSFELSFLKTQVWVMAAMLTM